MKSIRMSLGAVLVLSMTLSVSGTLHANEKPIILKPHRAVYAMGLAGATGTGLSHAEAARRLRVAMPCILAAG